MLLMLMMEGQPWSRITIPNNKNNNEQDILARVLLVS